MQCTWTESSTGQCAEVALYKHTSTDGQVWAELCEEHHKIIEDIIKLPPKQVMSAWIKAQGGPKKAAERM